MSTPSPYLVGDFAPVEREVTVANLPVEGEIPADLHGIYVRNGPNARFAPKGRYHWFDGDGMLHALHFENGAARYRNRWVRTRGLEREEAAGHALWSGLMESTRDNPAGARYKDTANTDVGFHNGSLVCLWYICGQPYRVDALTLETLGPAHFNERSEGEAPLLVSAHDKVDVRTGEMMFFNYGLQAPYMRYGVVDGDGALAHLTDIELPGPRLPHDMAVTENRSILMDLPMLYRPEALRARRWLIDFHPEMPARFGILPRHGAGAAIQWFEAESCYVYHTINAWEEGDEVVLVGCRVRDPTPEPDPSHGEWARMLANLSIMAELHEWRFDLKTGATRERQLDDRNAEFPTMNKRWLGRRTRYAYNVLIEYDPTMRFTGLVKYDTDTGASQCYEFGPERSASEPVFAPRPGATDEDDGYLVTYVHERGNAHGGAEGWIFSARDLAQGPLARVTLPQRVPLGFHACWVPGDAL